MMARLPTSLPSIVALTVFGAGVALLPNAARAAESIKKCGVAKVESANDCASLIVDLEVPSCEADAKWQGFWVECAANEKSAVFHGNSERYAYRVRLRNRGGKWSPTGPVEQVGRIFSVAAVPLAGVVKPAALDSSSPTNAPSGASTAIGAPAALPGSAGVDTKVPPTLGTATPTPIPSPVPYAFGGSFRTRLEGQDRTDFVSYRSFTFVRARMDFTATPNDRMTVFVQPQFAKVYGERIFTPGVVASGANAGSANNAVGDTSGQTLDNAATFHQGYLDFHPSANFRFIVGRQTLAYGNELVIGVSDWNNIGRAYDAARARANYSFGTTDIFTSKIRDNNITGEGTQDRNFSGVYNRWDFGPGLKNVDTYVLLSDNDQLRGSAFGYNGVNGSLYTYGARAQSNIGIFDYRGEGTFQGKAATGYQWDGEIGVTVPGKLQLRVSGEAFKADPDYDSLYPTYHKWLGHADLLGRRNIEGEGAHLSFVPANGFKFSSDYQIFNRVRADAPAYRKNGYDPYTAKSGAKKLGQELDLDLQFTDSPYLTFLGGVARFWESDYFHDLGTRKNPDYFYVQVEAKF